MFATATAPILNAKHSGAGTLPDCGGSCKNAACHAITATVYLMSPIVLLSATLAAAPVPVSPEFHSFDQQVKLGQVLDKQLAHPAPIRFETRMTRLPNGQLRRDCDRSEHDLAKSLPSFGVHLRRP